MPSTRISTAVLGLAVTDVVKFLEQAETTLEPVVCPLTDEERKSAVRPSVRFTAAGRALARAALEFPDLATRAKFDGDAVTEDLDNAEALESVLQLLQALTRKVEDTRLLWRARAYEPSLELYKIGKAVGESDGELNELVAPMAEVFKARKKPASRKSKKKAKTEPKAETAPTE